jgi:hypothetical protein
MAKVNTPPTPDPLPSEGGSYLLDEQTGKWILLERTLPAPLPSSDPEPAAPTEPTPPSPAPEPAAE